MNSFELAKAHTTEQARELLAERPGSVLKAGGIDVIDHLKQHLIAPPRLVDIKSVDGLDESEVYGDGTLRIVAVATLARSGAH